MSTREMLKRDIDVLPEESLAAVKEFLRFFIEYPSSLEIGNTEKGYQLLNKYKKRVIPPIDEKKELMDYLDERYGCID
jgi:hypothetical protein